ncbi:MAG TPA: hypothetical protein VLD37_00425 [Candidatus Bilamarchaeum sp.]|nr:hypothetical protein [Candidatus Bilamarchaeum sp.]
MRFVILGLLVIALLIAGCGQQAPPKANNTPPVQQPPPTTQPPAQPPVRPPPNVTNGTLDDKVFSDDLGEALDDLDAVTDASELAQTSPNTFCSSDDDCWCRIFDGAQFQPGKAPGQCDTGKNRCQQCLYR